MNSLTRSWFGSSLAQWFQLHLHVCGVAQQRLYVAIEHLPRHAYTCCADCEADQKLFKCSHCHPSPTCAGTFRQNVGEMWGASYPPTHARARKHAHACNAPSVLTSDFSRNSEDGLNITKQNTQRRCVGKCTPMATGSPWFPGRANSLRDLLLGNWDVPPYTSNP